MSSKKIHLVVKDSGRGSISALGPHAVPSDLLPHICFKVVLVEVVSVVTIVSAKHVHMIFIDDGGV